MKILGIYGSPRKNGNTQQLLDAFLKGASEKGARIQKVFLGRIKITPCMEYYACMKTGTCSIKDEMTGLYKDIEQADIIAFASPIFFYGLTAQAKALIDRCQAFWARKYILKTPNPKRQIPKSKRRGFFISTAATKGKKVFDGAKLTIKYFFDALDVEYRGELLIRLSEYKDNITKHPTALEEAYEAGRKLATTDTH
jgi:multimeric flavodoxin WrbA